jgi:hypothetical protein
VEVSGLNIVCHVGFRLTMAFDDPVPRVIVPHVNTENTEDLQTKRLKLKLPDTDLSLTCVWNERMKFLHSCRKQTS